MEAVGATDFSRTCVDETGRCPAGRPWGWRPHYLCGGPSDNLSQRYTRFVRGAGRNAHRLDHISVTDGITGPTTRCPQVAQSSKTRAEWFRRVVFVPLATPTPLTPGLGADSFHTNPLNPYPPGNAKAGHKSTIAGLEDII